MTETEKQAMRQRIFGVPLNPALGKPAHNSYRMFAYHMLHMRALTAALALVLVFGGVGTAAAAQGALPGDLLYPVKVSINETVEVALATTPHARAEVSTKLAQRRVEEAEALAARGELNAAVGEKIAAHFEAHADSAHQSAEAVAIDDPAAAESLRTKLSSSLAAHGAILSTLSEGGALDNRRGVEVVAARVIARADTGRSAAAAVDPAAAPAADTSMSLMVAPDTGASGTEFLATGTGASTTEGTSTDLSLKNGALESAATSAAAVDAHRVERLAARAAQALSDARERFEEHKGEFAGIIVTKVSGELADIEETLARAAKARDAGNADEAAALYLQAFKHATKLEVLLRAEARLKRNVITPILEQKLITDPANFPLL